MMTVWYFAYGSNMQSHTFRGRRGIAWQRAIPARAPGWRIRFDKPPLIPSGTSFANIMPDPSSEVLGVAYEITADDHAHVELTEGVAIGNYVRQVVSVVRLDDGSRLADALTLTTDKAAPGMSPSTRYMSLIVAGAIEHALPADYVAWLRAIPAAEESDAERMLRSQLDTALRELRPGKKEPR
jgi:gamma-glutamylcyclotransferase